MILEFTWRGAHMKWEDGSWPKFSNKEQKGSDRKFFAEAMPHGTGWKAKLTIYSNDEDRGIYSPEGKADTPKEALEQALAELMGAVERVVQIPAGASE